MYFSIYVQNCQRKEGQALEGLFSIRTHSGHQGQDFQWKGKKVLNFAMEVKKIGTIDTFVHCTIHFYGNLGTESLFCFYMCTCYYAKTGICVR